MNWTLYFALGHIYTTDLRNFSELKDMEVRVNVTFAC